MSIIKICLVEFQSFARSSRNTPHTSQMPEDWYGEAQYGFYDLTISKTEIFIESVNYDGEVVLTHTVHPH